MTEPHVIRLRRWHVIGLLWIAALILGAPGRSWAESTIHFGLQAESPALGRPLRYSLYLPDGYRDHPGPLPVLTLLHGYGGDDRDWLNVGGLRGTMDRLIASSEVPPMIVVMPAAGNSWYVNSAAFGAVETAITRDLRAHVERHWPVRSNPPGRFVAGLSMGGYGALRFALRSPEDWRGVASLSGAIFPGFASAEEIKPGQLNLFGAAFGEPFDPARYDALNFFDRVPRLAEREAPLGIYISVGDEDYFRLERGSVALYLAMRDAGVPIEMRIRDGGHVWPLWRAELEHVLRFFGGLLAADKR